MPSNAKLKKQLMKLVYLLAIILLTYTVDYISKRTINQSLETSGTYLVTQVYDGDTIEVLMDGTREKVRFIGVDTPETGGNGTDIECYGPEASQYTKSLLEGERVTLLADPKTNNRDLYDRLLRYVVRSKDNLDVNLALIRDGYSPAYKVFPHTRSADFVAMEQDAQERSVGLWATCN